MKKNWNVAKIFTLLITVLFLASTLFVGCKEQEPEPEPEPSPVMYTVTYAVEGGGDSVTGLPETKTVEDGTVLKAADLPTLTAPEGWSFEGWYIGEEPFTSDYTVKSNITITAKFVENVAPSLPADPENPVEPEDPNKPEAPVTYIVVYNGVQIATLTEEEYIEYGNMLTATEDYTYNAETKTITLTDAGYAKVMGGGEEPEDPNKPETPVTYIVVYNGVQIATLTEEEYIEYGNMLTATEDYTYNAETKTITLTDAGYAKVTGGEEEPEVPEPPVTYTVTYTVEGIDANLVEDLPESGTVNEDTVISLPSLVSPTGYVFDGWFINDELVSQHTVVAAVTIVAKFSEKAVVADNVYTITNVPDIWAEIEGNLYVYAFNDDDVAWFAATYENNTLKFESDTEYPTCIAVICDGEGDWSNVLVQSPNLNVSEKTAALAFESLDGLFLRGTMNDWNQTPLTADSSCSTVYSVDFTGSDSTEFKIANESWGTAYGGWHIKGINIDITGDDNAIVGLSAKDYTMYIFPCKIDNDKIYVYIK